MKAFMRRAMAYKELRKYAKAMSDLENAEKIEDSKEIAQLISEVSMLWEDHKRLGERKLQDQEIEELTQAELLAGKIGS
eukprot:UN13408